MSTPEEKQRKRQRIRSHIAKDLVVNPRYRQRKVEDKKKKIDVSKLSHAELVRLINERDEDNE